METLIGGNFHSWKLMGVVKNVYEKYMGGVGGLPPNRELENIALD